MNLKEWKNRKKLKIEEVERQILIFSTSYLFLEFVDFSSLWKNNASNLVL